MNKHKSVFLFLLYGIAGLALYFFIKKTFFLLFPIFFAFLCSEGIRGSFARLHPLAAPVKRILTVLLLLIFFALFSLFAVLMVERLLHYTTVLTKFLSEHGEGITDFCREQIHRLEKLLSPFLGEASEQRFTLYLPTLFQDFLKKALEALPHLIAAIASFLPQFFISLVIFIISCYYFSCDWDRIRVFYKETLPPKLCDWTNLMKKHFFRSLKQFGKAYFLLFLMNFAILYLGLVLLKSKNAIGYAFVIALIDLLPVLGCGTILVPWSVSAFLMGKVGMAIGLLVLFLVTLFAHQCAEPKILGSSIGLHPVLSLVLVLLGLKLFGFWGMILFPLGVTSYLNAKEEYKMQDQSKEIGL